MQSSERIKSKIKGIDKRNEKIVIRSVCKIKLTETNRRRSIKINDINPKLRKVKITNPERILINEIRDAKTVSRE